MRVGQRSTGVDQGARTAGDAVLLGSGPASAAAGEREPLLRSCSTALAPAVSEAGARDSRGSGRTRAHPPAQAHRRRVRWLPSPQGWRQTRCPSMAAIYFDMYMKGRFLLSVTSTIME